MVTCHASRSPWPAGTHARAPRSHVPRREHVPPPRARRLLKPSCPLLEELGKRLAFEVRVCVQRWRAVRVMRFKGVVLKILRVGVSHTRLRATRVQVAVGANGALWVRAGSAAETIAVVRAVAGAERLSDEEAVAHAAACAIATT
jgi:hypothetical protein